MSRCGLTDYERDWETYLLVAYCFYAKIGSRNGVILLKMFAMKIWRESYSPSPTYTSDTVAFRDERKKKSKQELRKN
jgi:hypothetical protein